MSYRFNVKLKFTSENYIMFLKRIKQSRWINKIVETCQAKLGATDIKLLERKNPRQTYQSRLKKILIKYEGTSEKETKKFFLINYVER